MLKGGKEERGNFKSAFYYIILEFYAAVSREQQ